MADGDDVLRTRMPVTVRYEWSAGPGTSDHLQALIEGRFVGARCPNCRLVIFPPRNGTCARCGVILAEPVEVGPRGTVTTFCIVNVPFMGQKIKIPYVAASILLDGADLSVQHLLQECEATDVRIGMRVEPVWKDPSEWGPSLESIAHFRPTGEPDVDPTGLGGGGI